MKQFLFTLMIPLARVWLCTWRIKVLGESIPKKEGIIGIWHEDLLPGLFGFRNRELGILMSKSQDGTLGATLASSMNYKVFRGSTSRGYFSLRKLAEFIGKRKKTGNPALSGMALDGPKGPYRQIQPGTVWLSQKTNIPVYPTFSWSRRYLKLNNWDNTKVPLPFSTVYLYLGKGFIPCDERNLDEAMTKTLNQMSSELKNKLEVPLT